MRIDKTGRSRRDMLKQSGAVLAASPVAVLAAPQCAKGVELPARTGTDSDNLFTRIGVRPLINARVAGAESEAASREVFRLMMETK